MIVEVLADYYAAHDRCRALARAGIDAQVARQGIEVLRVGLSVARSSLDAKDAPAPLRKVRGRPLPPTGGNRPPRRRMSMRIKNDRMIKAIDAIIAANKQQARS